MNGVLSAKCFETQMNESLCRIFRKTSKNKLVKGHGLQSKEVKDDEVSHVQLRK